jgi:starch synthase
MVSSEVEPFARTGGLGDVVRGLSSALVEQGCDVVIVTPRYGISHLPPGASAWPAPLSVRLGWGPEDVYSIGVLEASMQTVGHGPPRICFLEHDHLFGRDGIYGDAHGSFGDNDLRFGVMSSGALAVAERIWPSGGADIVHAHDWHGAPAIIALRRDGVASTHPKTVFTIHNLSFQGVFGAGVLDRLGLPNALFESGIVAHDGQVNLMRGAIVLADRVTTVSPTYAQEIRGPRDGCGLDPLLNASASKLVGILNGIDQSRFDPSSDAALISSYAATSPGGGKSRCKQALVTELGLDDGDGPLFASVSRLSEQKGIDLLLAVVPSLVERGVRFALVGAGDADLEESLRAIARRYPGRVASRIAFDGALARRVYAGADFFVVPSRYEPCGLTQLYAMRYGAIPVVTDVGGLHDTVSPVFAIHDVGTGLVAATADSTSLLIACDDALALFRDAASHQKAVVRAMIRDSSWSVSAREYLALYEALLI